MIRFAFENIGVRRVATHLRKTVGLLFVGSSLAVLAAPFSAEAGQSQALQIMKRTAASSARIKPFRRAKVKAITATRGTATTSSGSSGSTTTGGGVIKTGSGTLQLSGGDTVNTVTVPTGTLNPGSIDGTLISGSTVIISGGTLSLGNSNSITGTLSPITGVSNTLEMIPGTPAPVTQGTLTTGVNPILIATPGNGTLPTLVHIQGGLNGTLNGPFLDSAALVQADDTVLLSGSFSTAEPAQAISIEYGLDDTFLSTVPVALNDINFQGTSNFGSFAKELSSLTPGATYQYRITVIDAGGVSISRSGVFTTSGQLP